ncbi:ATP-binding cassette domain-containing protein [Rubinisphaera margarita]|uniref:ATP-binding cassette domain-containing protein n=1 Tax=Rubinisphaera margarita TaxID=2909586 RepID=UPI001EE830D4|nr:excinuclease ABC subunit UvrA [Rubinisphaera margarita]MCG6155999.1 excinuclease ABC subunit UvrA [Rubinisphaera margarita]
MIITSTSHSIWIRNARTHNLQGVDVEIPHGRLTVVTGVSGSGKSSLVFQTLFAEGQRRFLGTLSGHSAGLLTSLPRGEVDEITGLSPVISVPQQRPHVSSRSTVATMTELLDYLRLLYSQVGTVFCPECLVPVRSQTRDQIISRILELPERSKVQLLAPVVRGKKGTHEELFQRISREGFVRARVDGQIVEFAEEPPLAKTKPHDIDVVVDRLILKPEIRQRLADSVEQALKLGDGGCIALVHADEEFVDHVFHRDLNCPSCGQAFAPLEPRSFSWHSAHGACPVCEGTGRESGPAEGDEDEVEHGDAASCSACNGTRLGPVSRNVRVAETTLPTLLGLRISAAAGWVKDLRAAAADQRGQSIIDKLAGPLAFRLQSLIDLGVGYLTLDRSAETLAGGEVQRVRLARCLGTQLHGSCFILDEPTAGLHARDAQRLLDQLRQLTASGNTVICVEHSLDAIRAADHLLEFGPGGGTRGGQVVFSGSLSELSAGQTPTSRALNGEFDPQTSGPFSGSDRGHLQLKHVQLHNLDDVSIEIPLGSLTAVTGVSGSGKSSLILDSLAVLLKKALRDEKTEADEERLGSLRFDGKLQRAAIVDQSPPGGNLRSCPATFSGAWDQIRRMLARTRLAKLRGFDDKRFSFNTTEGTCSFCGGAGQIRTRHHLVHQEQVKCPECHGRRFNAQTLAVKYRGHSAYDLLDMTVADALDFWSEVESIQRCLRPYRDIGIDYLKMGQPTSTLSGGEAQRTKLARALSEELKDGVYIMDEPTSGLHWADVSLFIATLRTLQERGNTIIVVEHHPLIQAAADWHIELGPGAGAEGGTVLHCGLPELSDAAN